MHKDCDTCKYELYDIEDEPCNNCRYMPDSSSSTPVPTKWESDGSDTIGEEIINFSPDWVNATKDLIDEGYSIIEIIEALKILYENEGETK